MQDTCSSGILVDLFADVWVETVQEDVSELIAADDSLVIDIGDASEETRLRVIGKDEELSRWDRSVDAVECRFLHVANDDSGSNNIDRGDSGREALLS